MSYVFLKEVRDKKILSLSKQNNISVDLRNSGGHLRMLLIDF